MLNNYEESAQEYCCPLPAMVQTRGRTKRSYFPEKHINIVLLSDNLDVRPLDFAVIVATAPIAFFSVVFIDCFSY